jgi:hypothetical protein
VLADALVARDLLAAQAARDERQDLRLPLGEIGGPRSLADDGAGPGPAAEAADQEPADVEAEHTKEDGHDLRRWPSSP